MDTVVRLVAQVSVSRDDLGLPNINPDNSTTSIVNMVFGIAGAITVMLVTYGAFKYIISQGDPQATAKAKDTIMYALIGMALCVFSFAIVSFVVGRI